MGHGSQSFGPRNYEVVKMTSRSSVCCVRMRRSSGLWGTLGKTVDYLRVTDVTRGVAMISRTKAG